MNPRRRLGPFLPTVQQVAIGQPVTGWKTHGRAGGGPGGPPLRLDAAVAASVRCYRRRRRHRHHSVHRRYLNVHRSQVAISVDRFWSTVIPPQWSSSRAHPCPYPSDTYTYAHRYHYSYTVYFPFDKSYIYNFGNEFFFSLSLSFVRSSVRRHQQYFTV